MLRSGSCEFIISSIPGSSSKTIQYYRETYPVSNPIYLSNWLPLHANAVRLVACLISWIKDFLLGYHRLKTCPVFAQERLTLQTDYFIPLSHVAHTTTNHMSVFFPAICINVNKNLFFFTEPRCSLPKYTQTFLCYHLNFCHEVESIYVNILSR